MVSLEGYEETASREFDQNFRDYSSQLLIACPIWFVKEFKAA